MNWESGMQGDSKEKFKAFTQETFPEEIVSLLETHLERIVTSYLEYLESGRCEIELEARLGSITKRYQRINLPVTGPVVLERSQFGSTSMDYEFAAGLSKEKYNNLLSYVESILNVNGEDEDSPVLSKPVKQHTVDEIFRVKVGAKANDIAASVVGNKDYDIRKTFKSPRNNVDVPIEVVHKQRIENFHLYLGRNTDDSNDLHDHANKDYESFWIDVRISIALEWKFGRMPRGTLEKKLTRERMRVTYPLLGVMRVDATEVASNTNQANQKNQRWQNKQDGIQYEFEVEMSPHVIMEGINKSVKEGDSSYLNINIGNFIRFIRGCAEYLNCSSSASDISGSGNLLHVITDCKEIRQKHLEDYVHYLSPVVPIIGDYLYRAVAPEIKALHEAGVGVLGPLTDKDVAEATRFGLNERDKKILDEQRAEQQLRRAGGG